jgi:hypothetical protein
MKVFFGGAAAVVLAVLAGPSIAGGMDAPDTDASVASESDAGADAGQQDGTDGSVPGDADTDDTPSDEPGLLGATTGGISDEIDTNLVTDIGVFLPGGDTDQPVDVVQPGPTEDDTQVITITSEPQETSGLLQDSATTEASALPAPDFGSSGCAYVPVRRGVVCD